jgi:hypothetical protein
MPLHKFRWPPPHTPITDCDDQHDHRELCTYRVQRRMLRVKHQKGHGLGPTGKGGTVRTKAGCWRVIFGDWMTIRQPKVTRTGGCEGRRGRVSNVISHEASPGNTACSAERSESHVISFCGPGWDGRGLKFGRGSGGYTRKPVVLASHA